MSDMAKTGAFVGVALLCCVAALATRPPQLTFEEFGDQGDPFYPHFTDPLLAAALEVIDYDEASGTKRPFKVAVNDGVWTIPSHYDYPADGKDRLANTAAALIDLRKDVIQSDRVQDHQALGVIDPLDETVTTLQGRGQRAMLRDASGNVLADFIFGKPDESRQGFRYVRLPDKKRTYSVRVDLDMSTRFADWIETNLLDLKVTDVVGIEINDYSVDEGSGVADVRDHIVLSKTANTWLLEGLPEGQTLDDAKVRTMASALSRITITGVRPKPPSLTRDLKTREGLQIDLGTRMSLSSKGFFISSDGRLLSNEGELTVHDNSGISYTLRFGEVLFGDGLAVSAGSESEGDTGTRESEGEENRYLFVTAALDDSQLPPKPTPPEGDSPAAAGEAAPAEGEDPAEAYERQLKDWQAQVDQARQRASELNDRFADWYYVISDKDFSKIRLSRDQLIKEPAKTP